MSSWRVHVHNNESSAVEYVYSTERKWREPMVILIKPEDDGKVLFTVLFAFRNPGSEL